MKRVVLLSLFLTLVGCSTTPQKQVSQSDLMLAGITHFNKKAFNTFYVPSHGAIGDAIAIAKYKSQGNSTLGNQLYSTILHALTTKANNVVVGGSNTNLNIEVIKNALNVADSRLDGLVVYLIGTSEKFPNIQSKFNALGAEFISSED